MNNWFNTSYEFLVRRLKAVGDAFERAIDAALESARSWSSSLRSDRYSSQPSPKSETLDTTTLSPPTVAVDLEEGTQIYAIGDIHGRADLLAKLLDKIDADAAEFDGETHIVFLGDYIDRGLQSKQVIDTLLSDRLSKYSAHFLKGNHEDALLNFLEDPGFGPKWAAYGGRETLVSYGVRPPRSMSLNDEWRAAHDAFLKAFPNKHNSFFRDLPTRLRIGSYGFVHAGLRPGKSFEEQEDYDLMWIRDEFLRAEAAFDVMVVHGHTPIDAPFHDHRRINVDTGAYFTGRLTAAKLQGQSVDFIATTTG